MSGGLSIKDLEAAVADARAFRNIAHGIAGAEGGIAKGVAPADAEMLAAMARRPPSGLRICKFGSRSVVGTVGLPSGPAALKYYFPRGLHKALAYGLRGSRALQSWVAGHAFCRIGVSTPRPLAFAEWRVAGVWVRQSFLAVEFVSGIPLGQWAAAHRDDPEALREIAAQLHESFQRMREFRAVHGDLKASNILVTGERKAVFIDLDSAELLLPAARWRRAWDKDRARFAANWRADPVLAEAFREAS
jgi:serine/threonine protein kinase